jgi:putative endonuclease
MSKNLFTVYILYSAVVDRYFVGESKDFERQFKRHNSGKNPHTKSGIPWRAVLIERYKSRVESKGRLEKLRSSNDRRELVRAIRSERNEI